MKFWTDGSRIGLHKGAPIIGWGAVCDAGVVALGARVGGSNINAEMMAIADLLKRLIAYRSKLIEKESVIHIITDSLTSIQIINGYMKDKSEFDMNMENYQLADQIVKSIAKLNSMGKKVEFEHKA